MFDICAHNRMVARLERRRVLKWLVPAVVAGSGAGLTVGVVLIWVLGG